MKEKLLKALRELKPTDKNGFEGLIAKLLERLTGRHFYLAKSGTQSGRDMSSSSLNADAIAVECKRYTKDRSLNERELLGELVQVAQSIPDLDLWVLVASRDIPSQLHESLRRTAKDLGISYLSISTEDETPSSLELLCALGKDLVLDYLQNSSNQPSIQKHLEEIANFLDFNQKIGCIPVLQKAPNRGRKKKK